MPQNENELRRKIVEIGRPRVRKGWVAANDGNISVRLDEERFWRRPPASARA
jgi:L-fuculose-phosphate aldolase